MSKDQSNHWYDEMQHRDRVIADAVAEMVRPIEWQYFVTVEFPWDVRPETADRKFNAFINELERGMKTRIGFVAAKESRSKSGAAVPLHFHCCLTALKPIDGSQIECIWLRLVHRTKSPEQDLVRVEPYNAARRGVEYIVKMIGTLEADWDFQWLHLFNPAIECTPKLDHSSLRRDRRWQQQLTQSTQGHPGLEVEIIVMPGTSDPDAYVRAFGDLRIGVSEFRKLVRTDLFTWKLRKEVEEGGDPYEIAKRTLPIIVNVPDNMDRLAMADRLAEATGLNREFVQRELLRLLDTNEMKVEEELAAIAQQTSKALLQNPKAMDAILATAATRRDAILESKVGYDAQANLKSFEVTIEKMEAATDMFELVTGYPIFDSLMGGVPKEGALFTLPGKPFHGKSILIDNFIVNMLRLNPNLQVMLHHVDDAALLRVPRILGIMSKLSSRAISKAGTSRAGAFGEEFDERYNKAVTELRGWITDERLILADQARLIGSLPAHERWIKEIRRRNSHGSFISIGDNFHLFDMPGMEPGEGKVREMSKFIAGLPTKHGITTMFTMELPKDILKPGTRPKYTDSKNSGGIAFDSKVNLNVYQELQDLGDESTLVWRSPDFMEETVDPSGAVAMSEKVLPIIEAIIDKNKVTGLVKTIYYRLEPMSGVLEECSSLEQITLQTAMDAARKERRWRTGGRLPRTAGTSNQGGPEGPSTQGPMNNNLVYLSGPIAGLTFTESADWREYATKCFPPHIQGVSPLRGHRMLEGLGPIKNLMIDHPFRTDRSINRRDHFDTLRAAVVLVNLIGAKTVSIGTVMEIAWAFDHGIPIILAMEPEGNVHDHPMVRDCVSIRVASLDEAIEAAVAFAAPHEFLIWTRIEQVQMLREEHLLDTRLPPLRENHSGSILA